MRSLDLKLHGAEHAPRALTETAITQLEHSLRDFPDNQAGIRITNAPNVASQLATNAPIGQVVARYLGPNTQPVRAILFDKSPLQNWSLGWHQDRTIAVKARSEVTDFGPWTIKAGITHVAPPQRLLNAMVTLRIHLDAVSPDNAPLLIAPGSHRYGLIMEERIANIVAECGTYACHAERGDIWLYSTPILHASEASRSTAQRRVLQVDYSADSLPHPLQWLGI